jgi:NADH dehydrogenase
MQEGRYVANSITRRFRGLKMLPFRYRSKGSLAVIGRNAAVAHFGRLHVSGFFAWLLWAFVHIHNLIEFDNKMLVLFQWAWNYFTRKRGARLITNK